MSEGTDTEEPCKADVDEEAFPPHAEELKKLRKLRTEVLRYCEMMLKHASDEYNDPRFYPCGSGFWSLYSEARK